MLVDDGFSTPSTYRGYDCEEIGTTALQSPGPSVLLRVQRDMHLY